MEASVLLVGETKKKVNKNFNSNDHCNGDATKQ